MGKIRKKSTSNDTNKTNEIFQKKLYKLFKILTFVLFSTHNSNFSPIPTKHFRAKKYQFTSGTRAIQHIVERATKDEFHGYRLTRPSAPPRLISPTSARRIRAGMNAKWCSWTGRQISTRMAPGST